MSEDHPTHDEPSRASVLDAHAPPSDEAPSTLSKDEMFELLKNQRRRDALRYLREDGESTLSDLAERIAAKENDIEVVELSSAQRKRVYIGLYQCHLPKLDDAGVVDFEKHRGDVERLDAAAQLDSYLDPPAGDAESAATDQDDEAVLDGRTAVHADRGSESASDDAVSPASLPGSFEPRHDDGLDARRLAGAVLAVGLVSLSDAPGLRRVPTPVLALVATAVAAVAGDTPR